MVPSAVMSAPGLHRESRVLALAVAAHVGLELGAKLLHEGQGGHGRALAEGADRVAHDAVGNLVQVVELRHRGFPLEELVADPLEPGAALAARRALAA